MYELSVERSFCAAHAIVIAGEREPMHGHTWLVRVVVRGAELDADDLLCDFHAVERTLDRLIRPFRDRCLNETAPFDRVNPTAERVARHIAEGFAGDLPAGVSVGSVSVTEAPGCVATYEPPAT
ncbi:MAG: 6-carboxytetrahydropterin synthase [Phycisphaerales bacterium]|nr:6-carboxytetrahydropterin synthase [Phycisphaerales bacterium]